MQIVYVAGPFTAKTAWDIAENVRNAERVGLLVAQSGAMPLIPHANSHLFFGQCTAEFWYEGTKELLVRSDAAIFIPNWRSSVGSVGEWDLCQKMGKPSFDLSRYYPEVFADLIPDFIASLPTVIL